MSCKPLPVLLLGLAALVALAAAATDYCGVCAEHTLCKFKTTSAGSACRNYKWTALTAANIQTVLKAHNSLRNKVALGQESRGLNQSKQPTAANMRKMLWNTELAAIAQRWASQCTFEHDACRNTADKSYVGQNVYWEASTATLAAPNWAKAVQNWYDEVKDRAGSLNTVAFKSTSGPVVGHYTQVAWSTTNQVGCGYADYTTVQSGRDWNARVIVCNYKPGGNIIGRNMYEAGTPASKCPSGTSKDSTYTGLCA